MYIPKKGCYRSNVEKKEIVVEWKYGNAKGFRSTKEAERFINLICKKTAPDMEYSVSGI
jgi:hypothetical protein